MLTRGVGQRLDTAVVLETGAVKRHSGDASGLRTFGDNPADDGCGRRLTGQDGIERNVLLDAAVGPPGATESRHLGVLQAELGQTCQLCLT